MFSRTYANNVQLRQLTLFTEHNNENCEMQTRSSLMLAILLFSLRTLLVFAPDINPSQTAKLHCQDGTEFNLWWVTTFTIIKKDPLMDDRSSVQPVVLPKYGLTFSLTVSTARS